jgi:hypothetical protein
MGGAAYLVLDREQVPAVGEVDDIAKTVLVRVVLLGDQAAFEQPTVGAGKFVMYICTWWPS